MRLPRGDIFIFKNRNDEIQVKIYSIVSFKVTLFVTDANETSFLVILTRRINIHRTFGNGLYARTYGTHKSSGRSKGNFRITDGEWEKFLTSSERVRDDPRALYA